MFAPWSQNVRCKLVLRDSLLTPSASERVPIDLRNIHDMIALLQENKIREREVSISTDTPNRKRHFRERRRRGKGEVYRLSSGQLLCQILLTRAQGTCWGQSFRKGPAKNVLCSNGNTKNTKTSFLASGVFPFEHKTFLAGPFLNDCPQHVP